MVYTTYSTSSIISLRSYSTLTNYSYEKCPSTCCSCCSSFPINSCKFMLHLNPTVLYGLRQSTLIQWPPSRRFILAPSDLYRCRSSIYDVGSCCCSQSCCIKQEKIDRICKEKCCVKEKSMDVNKIKARIARPRRDSSSNALGDAEAMLSLLTEDTMKECVVVRERNRRSYLDGKVIRRPNVVNDNVRDRKQNVENVYRESESKNHRLVRSSWKWDQSCEEGRTRKEEMESLSKDEDRRLRRRESSSSYYSFSDSGEFESDMEDQIREGQFVGESLTSHKKDSRKNGGVGSGEEVKQEWQGYRDEKDGVLRISAHDGSRGGSSIQHDWRKKSEKKLTEESDVIKSRTDSVVRQSQISQAKESNSINASSSKKQSSYHDEMTTSDFKTLGQSSSYMQKENKTSRYSNSSSQHELSTQKNRENSGTASGTWRRPNQGEDLKVAGNLVQESGCDHCKTCGRSIEERTTKSDFQQHIDSSERRTDARLTINADSLSESRHRKHGKSTSSLQSSVEEEIEQRNQIHQVTGQTSAKRKSQLHRDTISTENNRAQSTLRETQQSKAQMHDFAESLRTSGEVQSESRRRKEEKSSTSVQTSAKEEEQHDKSSLEPAQVVARRKSEHFNEIVNTDASYLQSTLRSQQQSDTRMKHLEENTASLIAAEQVKGLRDGKVTKNLESSKVLHTEIGDSRVHSSNLEINNQSAFNKRVYDEQIYSKETVKSVEELVERRKQIDESIVQSAIRTKLQGPYTEHVTDEATISGTPVSFSGEEFKSGQLSMTSPPYHYVNRRSQFHEASSSSVRNDMGMAMEPGSGNKHEHLQARTPSSYGEVDDSEGKSSEEYSPEDALISASRMQESASLIVGEFVEKMSHEASTSETSSKKLVKLDFKRQDEKNKPKGSTQLDTDKQADLLPGVSIPVSEKKRSQKIESKRSSGVSSPDSEKKRSVKLDSRHSSADSGTKGSVDQMWDVKDHFVQEPSEMTRLEGATSESIVAVRTGKFLWNIVAGICRLRWGSHSKNQRSPVKRQSSPSGSASGETWFSGDEADEANGDDMKTDQISSRQETTTSDQLLLRTTGSRKEDIKLVSLDDKSTLVDVGASSSSGVLKSSSLSAGAFVSESTNLNFPQDVSPPSPSPDSSKLSARQFRRSLAFEEIDGAENDEAVISALKEQPDYPVDEKQTDISTSEGTDVELSRRKLQRSKLVLQRFDEWEDAYRREREQQKVDEIFMREALSEAMKAADSWEVPVGAVLVQNGKIIARGYNLVEELRDSTAHAEMLCIREASNFLRTWRLSETTLYVTLEPCPMCAGAILQARISTLVWGAPNKLLGADGSWIRLFPEGVEGEERVEVSDKPAAPVHPFHPKMNIRRGILQEECADIMQQFFQLKRRKAKEKETPSEEPAQPSCFPKPHHRSKLLHKMHNVFHHSKQSDD